MTMYEIITHKKAGMELSTEEIQFFVEGFTDGSIPDYQASALLMAICLKGMSMRETVDLTLAMANSGDRCNLSGIPGKTADKHSTGGVGDKTSLVVIPIAAALGLHIAKMTGRGLGHTGGTADKLESIPGFNTSLSMEEFLQQVTTTGLAIIGQTGNLTPADKKLYALRDVTATVDSKPLIASSIMSKKLAGGNQTIVLDVKFGSGAFMKTPEDAKELASMMVDIGKEAGRNVVAVLSDMDLPLGNAVGNSLEVIEAVQTLQGKGPADLTELATTLAALMASAAYGTPLEDMKKAARQTLTDGTALKKFKDMVRAQHGDISVLENTDLFAKASVEYTLTADRDGYIVHMNTELVGHTALLLGAGRKTKEDRIDPSAGLILHKKTGDKVAPGEPLATFYCGSEALLPAAEDAYRTALTISNTPLTPTPLIADIIR